MIIGLQAQVSNPWTCAVGIRTDCREVFSSAIGSHSARRTEITERKHSQHTARFVAGCFIVQAALTLTLMPFSKMIRRFKHSKIESYE